MAQTTRDVVEQQTIEVDSGVHQGTGTLYIGFEDTVTITDTPLLRLHFSDYNLGSASSITITSMSDNAIQRLDSSTIEQWEDSSAYFNGDSVKIQLAVAPGDTDVFFEIDKVTIYKGASADDPDVFRETLLSQARAIFPNFDEFEETLCGVDNRTQFDDPRVGRLSYGGCTAWLTSNGSVLTAGHCVDGDPDLAGPLLPNGMLDGSIQVFELNVPSSLGDGTPVVAHPDDQYPIDRASVQWEYGGRNSTSNSLGQDWALFRINANPNTGLTPYQVYGEFFRLSQEQPNMNESIRITGYGVDNTPAGSIPSLFNRNSDNVTSQTDTGAYVGESQINNGMQHQYQVDTTGGNSGSPITHENSGFAIGIHTTGGCQATSGSNSGVSFNYQLLAEAIENFHGTNTVYVDHEYDADSETGSIFAPFDKISEALTVAEPGATISIVAGEYKDSIFIEEPVKLIAPVGPVTLVKP